MLAFFIMDIQTAAKYMVHGYRVRRPSDPDIAYLYYHQDRLWAKSLLLGQLPICLLMEDLLADDWELITDGITNHFPLEYST